MRKQVFPTSESLGSAATSIMRPVSLGLLGMMACLAIALGAPACAQSEGEADATISADVETVRTIVLESRTPPPPPVFFSAQVVANANIGTERIDQTVTLTVKVVQGKPDVLSFGLTGNGRVLEVKGDGIASWSVRQSGNDRFLDLQLEEGVIDPKPVIKISSPKYSLPTAVNLTHLGPGASVGFDSRVSFKYGPGVTGMLANVSGFVPLSGRKGESSFQTSTGGQIKLSLSRDSASPDPVELSDTSLNGIVDSDGQSARFQLATTARVTDPSVELTLLSGNAALVQMPEDENYQ
ncbi:MAG: hypothetical protein ACR2N1_23895, partial [Rubripirellula sp.]